MATENDEYPQPVSGSRHSQTLKCVKIRTHLIDSQINASIRDDAKCVGQIAFVKRAHSFFT